MSFIIFFRIIFLSLLIFLLDLSVDLGTSPLLLCISAALGAGSARIFVAKNISLRGVISVSIILLVIINLFFSYLSGIVASETKIFAVFLWLKQLDLAFYFLLLSLVTTFLALRYSAWITIETILLILATVSLHSDHRNFHFEFPKFIQTLSWKLGSNVLAAFVVVTTAVSGIYLSYFSLASNRKVSLPRGNEIPPVSLKRRFVALVTPILLVLFGSLMTYRSFSSLTEAGGILSNGVGQNNSPGNSPLGFHSALGGSNEPAALFRIDGDYKNNPFTPMLYIRESALSEMGKNEILVAGDGYDNDVPHVTPENRFSREQDDDLPGREELSQSVYLISSHKTAFGIDYPISIVPLKNPNSSRFKGAYKVKSLVPQMKASDLGFAAEIGDPSWSKLEWEHYLKTHADKRYTDLAFSLTADKPSPFDKITAITAYLSKNATYTLSPRHEVPASGDPVDPFLFGDMRGYCVHFAHASVYMLRALGIPARIGTGYMTDLSQAKDGHVLLRMSDRHAWAEVYIRTLGWVPFDTQPEKVESHADTNVDMNLLEELMGQLEPDEEILPKDIIKDEKNVTPESAWEAPDSKILFVIAFSIVFLIALIKLYLRFSWIWTRDPRKLIHSTNLSLYSTLLDLGYERQYGETRSEFVKNLISRRVTDSSALTNLLINEIYSNPASKNPVSREDVLKAFREQKSQLGRISYLKKILAVLNPLSAFRLGVSGALLKLNSLIRRLKIKNLIVLIALPTTLAAGFFIDYAQADKTSDFSLPDISSLIDPDDTNKSAEQLVGDANLLLMDKRPIDARVKLLKALEKDPSYYKAHAILGEYYIVHVGHFRLALKYIKRAQQLFLQQNGNPPYDNDITVRAEHAYILYLLIQARLNLDNYQGALEMLDEYASYDYYSSWYPGTRAWVLMKLDRIKDAIQVARSGILSGADEGRTLNMLGILLSMDGEPENALKVFKQAINYEVALGETGQPATPLNNSGEVYKESFEDDKAESTWKKAIRLPDGCEHVLPTLNLSILLMDQLRYKEAEQAVNEFEECIKQFTLRNDEEHSALVNLIRGRISLYNGDPDSAIKLFNKSLEGTQWFGKIGTNESDLKSAAYLSLYQAQSAKREQLSTTNFDSYYDYLLSLKERLELKARSWWSLRRAREILAGELKDFEDLHIRNTDSLLDYGSLGDLAGTFPPSLLEAKIKYLQQSDSRKEADNFYKIYLAQSYLMHGDKTSAAEIVDKTLPLLRVRYDDRLYLQALLIKLNIFPASSSEYEALAPVAYSMSKSILRNKGLCLPVGINGSESKVSGLLLDSGFCKTQANSQDRYLITADFYNGEYILSFNESSKRLFTVKDASAESAVNKLNDMVFSEDSKQPVL